MNKSTTLLLDLDGTLADTAPDLTWALNQVRAEQALAPLPLETVRPSVSHGAAAMIELGFGLAPGGERAETLRARLLEHYAQHLCVDTRLFPGMDDVLCACERNALKWGVVTNKPAFFTDPLLEQLGLNGRAACVVSGDTIARRKPHPEPLLYACRLAGGTPARSLYVGDAARDIQAGRDAGMTTLVAAFGYLGSHDEPARWGADGFVRSPDDIRGWLALP